MDTFFSKLIFLTVGFLSLLFYSVISKADQYSDSDIFLMQKQYELGFMSWETKVPNKVIYFLSPVISEADQLFIPAVSAMQIKYELGFINWHPEVQNKVIYGKNSLQIVTDYSREHYQLSSNLPVSQFESIAIHFKGTVKKGGFGVGVLDSDGNWLAIKYFKSPGYYEGTIGTDLFGNKHVLVIIANGYTESIESEFTLNNFEIYLSPSKLTYLTDVPAKS